VRHLSLYRCRPVVISVCRLSLYRCRPVVISVCHLSLYRCRPVVISVCHLSLYRCKPVVISVCHLSLYRCRPVVMSVQACRYVGAGLSLCRYRPVVFICIFLFQYLMMVAIKTETCCTERLLTTKISNLNNRLCIALFHYVK